MLKDFAQLLSRHASGAGLDELADLGTVKKKSIELTPGQSAVTAIHEGASAGLGNVARINNGQPDLSRFINATPLAYEATGEGGGRGLGDGDKLRGLKTLGLISKGISDQVSKIQPSQDFMPEQSFAYAQNPIAQKLAGGAGLQMYAKGGKLSEDDINIVGEAGPEAIVNDEVIPLNPEMVAKSGGQAFPQSQLGIDQTEQQDQTVRPRIVGQDGMATPDASQLLSQRDQLMQQAQDVINRKRSKWGAFSDVGLGIVQGLNNAINHRDDPIIAHSEAIKQRDLGRIGQQIGMIDSEDTRKRNITKEDIENKYKQTQTENINADNLFNRDKLTQQGEIAASSAAQKKRDSFYRIHKNFDPAKASIADKRALAEFGETPESIGVYDFTKPDRKTVGGVVFQYDPNSKSFAETNLPKDGSKEIVEYEVTDKSTGVKSKYAVTSEKAASLKTQLEAAGMQIEAANTRQTKQQEFQGSQNDKDRQQRQQQFITNFQQKVANDAKAFAGDVAKRQQWKTEQIQKIRKDTSIPEDLQVQMIESIDRLP